MGTRGFYIRRELLVKLGCTWIGRMGFGNDVGDAIGA